VTAPQFTLGPWAPNVTRLSDGSISVAHVVAGPDRVSVAQISLHGEEETVANARLIAAALDLYALAEQFERVAEYELRKMQRENAEDDEGIRLRQLNLNLIRETIAKARGEQ
jgi:hypothetical protein